MKYDLTPPKTSCHLQEETHQDFCKQILKSRLFIGNYVERRYVDCISDYRDLITLHDSEKELKRLLEDMRSRLLRFYYMEKKVKIWIGITTPDCIPGAPNQVCIWAELEELAFGQYWFSIKTLRFRENEIIIKLKSIRYIENISLKTPRTRTISNSTSECNDETPLNQSDDRNNESIGLNHFVELFHSWNESIKKSIYDFMSKDINKENIVSAIKFISLLVISIVMGGFSLIKNLGIFGIRFMAEFNRCVKVATPIILRLIDTLNKVIGGIFIFLAMIWRDLIGGKPKTQNQPYRYSQIAYNKRPYWE